MKRFGLVLALLAVVVIVGPAVAQEQTGSLVGKITSDSGETLPGVSVEIKGPAGTLVAVTDARGDYRFPRVSPGAYKLTARLQGFQTYEASRVGISLGDKANVNVTLRISSVSETVVVTGDSVQIAVGENQTSTTIASEQIALLPKGRDFTTVVTQAPGVSNETYLGGISIDGASGSENRFVIDGVDTTNPQDGVSGQNFVTDFLEEVQVKSAGYAAEYGGSLGGVINAITKSGTNEFHGWAGAYYTNNALNGNPYGSDRPVYQQSWPGYYRTYENDDLSRIEPGFGLGGPIAKDALWFYAGYNPTLSSWSRTPYQDPAKPPVGTYDQDITSHYFTGNLKANLGSKLLLKLAANLSPRKTEGVLPSQDGSTPANANLGITTDRPTSSYSLYADYVPTSNIYVTGRLGYWNTDTQTSGIDAATRTSFTAGVMPGEGTDPAWQPSGFTSVPLTSFRGTDEDNWKRQSAGVDVNFFVTALGSHSLKAGVQYEKIENSVSSGDNGNFFEIRWGLPDRFGQGVQGTYGSVAVYRFRTQGAAESTNIGLFLQDTWNVTPNLTLNLGVRTEQERVPNYGHATDPTLPENAIEFDFKDKLAPRLGFSWDVAGKQKTKVYGSYGNYYDITKLEMPRGSFGADHWITHVYPLETTNWQSLPTGCATSDNTLSQNPCPALGNPKNRDLRLPTDPSTAIDPNLKPMENREFQLGIEHQITKNSVISARYVNKSLINTIEDIGYLVTYDDGTSGEEYITGNPGKGLVAGDPDGAGPIPPQPEAIRDYQAIELTYNRRFADNFSVRASYTYSKLTGNYSGLASSDEFGRTDPNVARYFDGLAYGFSDQGGIVDDVLNTDRPHGFEVQGAYRMPWAMTAGLNFSYFSGGPVSTDATFNGVNFFPKGRNDMGRLSSLTSVDLMLAQPFQIGSMQLEVSLNVLNLLDSNTVTRVGNVQYFEDVCTVNEDCDGSNAWYFGTLVPYDYDANMQANHATPVPSYGRPIAYQAPREFRFAVKVMF